MKISIIETSIEANAEELRQSNTLAQNFANMLSRCFMSREPIRYDDEESEKKDE